MIVKDESLVIRRCLDSVKNLIHYWVIVDTGSTDGTQQIIKDYLKDIPGELHEIPWVDFAYNRNMALKLAKNHGDYLLLIDADDQLILSDNGEWPPLDASVYCCPIQTDTDSFHHELLVATRHDWQWEGAIHERLVTSEPTTYSLIKNAMIVNTMEGKRSTVNKYLNDADILEKEIEKNPTDTRHVFHLAISYFLGEQYPSALTAFEKRASMGGNPEEVFYSMYSIGRVQEKLLMDTSTIIKSYEKAYQFSPTQAEPLYYLANFHLSQGAYLTSYLLAKFALEIPFPPDKEFVRFSIYDYELLMVLAESSYVLGRIKETCEAYRRLIQKFEEYLGQNQRSQEFKNRIAALLPGMKQFLIENEPESHR